MHMAELSIVVYPSGSQLVSSLEAKIICAECRASLMVLEVSFPAARRDTVARCTHQDMYSAIISNHAARRGSTHIRRPELKVLSWCDHYGVTYYQFARSVRLLRLLPIIMFGRWNAKVDIALVGCISCGRLRDTNHLCFVCESIGRILLADRRRYVTWCLTSDDLVAQDVARTIDHLFIELAVVSMSYVWVPA